METTLWKPAVELERIRLKQCQDELKQMILDNGIVWSPEFENQNRNYRWVIDTKQILLNPRGLYLTSLLFLEKMKRYKAVHLGGMTMASHLITSSIVYLSSFMNCGYNGFFIRKERKQTGLLKQIEGIVEPDSDVIIVDDGLNAADFATRSIELVERLGCRIKCIVVLINFQRREYEELKSKGYDIESIFTLGELGIGRPQAPAKPNMLKLIWKYGIINKNDYTAPKSTPFINENGIYVGSDQNKIMAIDFDGKLKWEFESDYHPEGVHSSPTVFDGKVICGSYSGYLYVLNENDGSLIWKNKACDFIGSSPILDVETKTIYIGLENSTLQGTMAAFNLDTGRLLWEFVTNGHVPSKPEICGGIIAFGSNDFNIYACNKNDGSRIWKFTTGAEPKGSPTIDKETKRVYATSFDGFLYCLDLIDGGLIWKKKLGCRLFNKPLIYDGKVLVSSYSGEVAALDKSNGKVKWFFMSQDSILSSPIEKDGRIFIGSNDGNVYAIGSENGKLLWKHKTNGKVTSSPRVYKDKLFISSNDGYLYCFEKQ